ncbi:unnamed protein product [Leptidea sinapis]|uniref:SRA1/Sec31 domain-containing protein n=1 Tax=Leptidea sinapis TaxID=189913 RepID=A0A5E4PTF9_9NEOP|nr:unnamed protein product [Leptidea sinapis]
MEDYKSNTVSGNSRAVFDPGWNDPPTLAYTSQQSNPNRPRNFLNKRVAFPLSNNSSLQSSLPTTVNLPPVAVVPPLITKPISTINIPEVVENGEKMLVEVKEVLIGILESSTELGSKAEGIRKRINTMEDMWRGGKLNVQVQKQMVELSEALKEENLSKADEIHKALMVDHVSCVGTWMPAVKQLIYHSIAKLELLSIDKDN